MALNIGIIADFNTDNLVRTMEKWPVGLGATVTAAPFGQVMQMLLQPSGEFWDRSYDLIVLWTFPGSVVAGFNNVLDFEGWSADELHREVDVFAELVRGLEGRVGHVFVPSWVAPVGSAHRPSIEMRNGIGAAAALLHESAPRGPPRRQPRRGGVRPPSGGSDRAANAFSKAGNLEDRIRRTCLETAET